jgi:hypothetical protein
MHLLRFRPSNSADFRIQIDKDFLERRREIDRDEKASAHLQKTINTELRKYSRVGIQRPAFRLRPRSDRGYSDSFVAPLFLCVVSLSKCIKTSARIDSRMYGQYTAAAPIEITFPTIKLVNVARAKRDATIFDLTRASG